MSTRNAYRIGAVSYLNTKPLVEGLAEFSPEITLSYDLPSRLADDLAAGRLDVALIPSIEYLQEPTYEIVSDACIACRGPVLSVKLLSRVPLPSVQTLALDEGSRTSVALVRILLQQRFGIEPTCIPLPIGAAEDAVDADAILLIGDRAIHASDQRYVEVWDLGEEWCGWSELPFVFAMWTARRGTIPDSIGEALAAARDRGLAQLLAIADREAAHVRLSPQTCLSYLRDNLHFHLGERERRGLELFQQHAIALGMAPAVAPTP